MDAAQDLDASHRDNSKRRGPSRRTPEAMWGWYMIRATLWFAPRAHTMCRIFGFRSVVPSQVHRSLLAAENALGVQSNEHPDGWGVAFYVDGAPHLTRSPTTALGDQLFHRLSGVASSQTVLAHVRKATQGELNVLNCHPFQHGRWVFAHNGDIPRFVHHRQKLMAEISPSLRRFVLGDTDSEVIFFIILTQLSQQVASHAGHSAHEAMAAVRKATSRIRAICDADAEDGKTCLLTLVMTDGHTLVALQGGKELYRSTYKTRCSDRDQCPSLAPECEAPSGTGFVNHFIVSSEPLQGENVWEPFVEDELLAVDPHMRMLGTRAPQQSTGPKAKLPIVPDG